MKIKFKDSFVKDLKSLKDKGLLKRVKEIIEAVEKSDFAGTNCKFEKA